MNRGKMSQNLSLISNYKTKKQRMVDDATKSLDSILDRGMSLIESNYKRHCVICGHSFETTDPGFATCSKRCQNERDRQVSDWIHGSLSAMVSKALEILEECPVEEKVYFIQGETSKLIKIGYSQDVQGRLDNLRASSPESLLLLIAINGDRQLEKQLHHRFSGLRKHGEWFCPDQEILDLIGDLKSAKSDEGSRQCQTNIQPKSL